MDTKFSILVNPAAGNGKALRHLEAVKKVLNVSDVPYLTYCSSSLEHAGILASEVAARGDLVVAVGGDGMAGAIAGAVSRAKPDGDGVFAIIPAGRGNDLARTHGIPFKPADAAKLLLAGRSRPMDMIEVTGADGTRAFVAGSLYLGIASMAGEIANNARLIRGSIAYTVAALRALAGWQPSRFTIDSVGPASPPSAIKSVLEFPGYGIVIANIPYFGAGMKVAPNADPRDGLLEVVLMRHAPKLAFLRVLTKIKNGSHVRLNQVSTACVTALIVACDRSLPVGADGESLDMLLPIRIRVIPGALNVIAPR